MSRVGGPLAPVQVAPTRRRCETLQSGARQAHGIQAGSERHGVLCRIGVLCLCRVSPRRAGRHGAAERRWIARRPRAGNRRRSADGGRRHLRPRPDHGGLDRAASPRRSSPTQTRWKQYVSWPAYGAWAADRIRRSGSTWPDHRRRPAPRRWGGRRRGSGYGATLSTSVGKRRPKPLDGYHADGTMVPMPDARAAAIAVEAQRGRVVNTLPRRIDNAAKIRVIATGAIEMA